MEYIRTAEVIGICLLQLFAVCLILFGGRKSILPFVAGLLLMLSLTIYAGLSCWPAPL